MAGDHTPESLPAISNCFNPRPRMAGDPICPQNRLAPGCFNPRPRMAGDADSPAVDTDAKVFQSTPAHGGRLYTTQQTSRDIAVSIHARAWRATAILAPLSHNRHCFNPRPRMAGDAILQNATGWVKPFQSTPAHGGRRGVRSREARLPSFNPRPRMAGDGYLPFQEYEYHSFNPRPRMAGDASLTVTTPNPRSFNPRPRMAGDSHGGGRDHQRDGFNPRPRMAGDLNGEILGPILEVSIHARAWGATRALKSASETVDVSIHARAWRATFVGDKSGSMSGVSIHARAWRATRRPGESAERLTRFNPRPRMAGDSWH